MLTKKITLLRCLAYIIAQCGGAILGTLIAASLNHDTYKAAGGAVNGSSTYGDRELVTAEIIATALLVFTVYAAIDVSRAGKVIHIGTLGPIAIGACPAAYDCFVCSSVPSLRRRRCRVCCAPRAAAHRRHQHQPGAVAGTGTDPWPVGIALGVLGGAAHRRRRVRLRLRVRDEGARAAVAAKAAGQGRVTRPCSKTNRHA